MAERWRVALPVGIAAVVLYGLIGVAIGYPCARIGIPKGVWIAKCPASGLRLSADVRAEGLVRGAEGRVVVEPDLGWLEGDGPNASPRWEGFGRGFSTTLTLRDAAGKDVPGLQVGWFKRAGEGRAAKVSLPDVPDGDYTLHAAIDAGFESVEVDVPLPLYAPAVVHVATDRPLYKPGQDVLVRSAILARTDLAPIEGRPGRWKVWTPSGEQVLVEKDPGGAWGIADTSFPLASDAEVGTWRVAYESGQARDEVTFDVRPFRLPRFSVELEPSATWYRPSDPLVVDGTARYTSGAPVANAPVTIRIVQTEGTWPIPLEWAESIERTTDSAGRFSVDLGDVPSDLVGQAGIAVRASVTDAAGETLVGTAPVALSVDDLAVEAVTELADGLVSGANNRVYLRVARPDGVPLRDTAIAVKNPWLPDAPVKEARTDADGVAAIQLDPGPPVTVVEPAVPIRVAPQRQEPALLSGASELGANRAIDLAERRTLDALQPAIDRCAHRAPAAVSLTARARVGRSGAVERQVVEAGTGRQYEPVERCVGAALQGARFPAGDLRTYELAWVLPESREARLDVDGSLPPDVFEAVSAAAIDARACLPRSPGRNGVLAYRVHLGFEGRRLDAAVDVADSLGSGADACVARSFAGLSLPDDGDRGLAVARLWYRMALPPGVGTPQPTTRVGYELQVAALQGTEEIGRTRLVLNPGAVPDLRIRATPSLAKPGDEVVFELVRGPSFSGQLPEELVLREGSREVAKAKVDPKARKVAFRLPDDADGFYRVEWGGARAVVFAARPDPLHVALATDRAAYRPGEQATLSVTTTAGEKPTAAAVSLVGVDLSLAQLAPLLGPDDWGRVTVRVTADKPAFGAFDPRALVLGQVRGENAAKAAVLRISQIPEDFAGDERISAYARHEADTATPLVDGFWRVYGRTAAATRAWESAAPAGEQLDPARVVAWWREALDAESREGRPAVDGFGRPLALESLPRDLLAELDPRRLVADATRLPEDDVGWMRYIDEEVR